MKKLLVLFLAITAQNALMAQGFETLKDRNGSKMYRGFITDSVLKTDTSCKWFGEAQKIYTPKETVVNTFKQNKDSVYFLIFLGTWCEDSHFIVPRFMKTLEMANYPKDKITIVAVDRKKKDMTNLTSTLHITNVPTIIVYKKGKEIGRVIEYGSTGKYDDEVAEIITKAN